MHCGCTRQQPVCARGTELFRVLQLIAAQLQTLPAGTQQAIAAQTLSAHAWDAYRAHVEGWREGDLKVRRVDAAWIVEQRQQDSWHVLFGVAEGESFVRAWLKERGYWRYAQLDAPHVRDQATGYYHRRTMPAEQTSATSVHPPSLSGLSVTPGRTVQEQQHAPQQRPMLLLEADQKRNIHVALLIALLIGQRQALTPLERLRVQRVVVEYLLLRSDTLLVQANDLNTIDRLIDEALALRVQLMRDRHL